jgi:hypothetical protein
VDFDTPVEGLESSEWRLAAPEEILPEYGWINEGIWRKLPIRCSKDGKYVGKQYRRVKSLARLAPPRTPSQKGIEGISLLWIKR